MGKITPDLEIRLESFIKGLIIGLIMVAGWYGFLGLRWYLESMRFPIVAASVTGLLAALVFMKPRPRDPMLVVITFFVSGVGWLILSGIFDFYEKIFLLTHPGSISSAPVDHATSNIYTLYYAVALAITFCFGLGIFYGIFHRNNAEKRPSRRNHEKSAPRRDPETSAARTAKEQPAPRAPEPKPVERKSEPTPAPRVTPVDDAVRKATSALPDFSDYINWQEQMMRPKAPRDVTPDEPAEIGFSLTGRWGAAAQKGPRPAQEMTPLPTWEEMLLQPPPVNPPATPGVPPVRPQTPPAPEKPTAAKVTPPPVNPPATPAAPPVRPQTPPAPERPTAAKVTPPPVNPPATPAAPPVRPLFTPPAPERPTAAADSPPPVNPSVTPARPPAPREERRTPAVTPTPRSENAPRLTEHVARYWRAFHEQRWDEIGDLFLPDAHISWPLTGESFTIRDFVRGKRGNPGDWTVQVKRVTETAGTVVTMSRVQSAARMEVFQVTSFFQFQENRIAAMEEYWAQEPPPPPPEPPEPPPSPRSMLRD